MAKSIKTMEDFSEFVGLSRPTVSKYFNDPASVRKKTRDAIEEALKKSGFLAQHFRGQSQSAAQQYPRDHHPELNRSLLHGTDQED